MSDRRIVCAAMRLGDKVVYGPRHHHCRDVLRGLGIDTEPWNRAIQGFVDNMGVFMTREEALMLALTNGQRVHRCGGDEHALYSENLY